MANIDTLRFSLTSMLLHAGRQWRRISGDALGGYGVSQAAASPLLMIGRLGGGVRQVALAEHVGIESASLVRLLDQLCAASLVRREEDAGDRRAKTLHLTDAGTDLVARIEARLDALRGQVLRDVSEADLEAGLRVFEAINRFAQDQPGDLDSAEALE